MNNRQSGNPAKANDDAATTQRDQQGIPLSDQDLDGMAGGAARRGPGTQTEDDAFVG